MKLSIEDLLQQCTVKIVTSKGSGTGFLVGPELILSCNHVVSGDANIPAEIGTKVRIRWPIQEAQEEHFFTEASVKCAFPNPFDLVLLRTVPPPGIKPSCVYLGQELKPRDPLYLFGYPDYDFPNGKPVTFYCEGFTGDSPKLVVFALGQVRPGMSGAPLLNQHTGGVCGIVKFTRDRGSDLGGGAVPINVVLEKIPEIKELQQFHQQDKTWTNQLSLNQRQILGLVPPPPSPIESYLRAMSSYCANQPYLTLNSVQSFSSLSDTYISPKLQPQVLTADSSVSSSQNEFGLGIDEVLKEQNQHVLLVGAPGTGKSSLLYQLVENAWSAPSRIGLDKPHLPIYIQLRHLAQASGSLEDRLQQALLAEGVVLPQVLPTGFFNDWPNQSERCWLILLDALDEVPNNQRLQFIQWLENVLKNFKQHRVVLTSRSVGSDIDLLNPNLFCRYELLPFTPKQIDEFSQRWFGQGAEQFISELKSLRFGDLYATPLLLTLMARVYLSKRILPKRQTDLYQQVLEIWLEEAHQRGLQAELGERISRVTKFALAQLALEMTKHPEAASVEQLSDFITEYFQDVLQLSKDEAQGMK